MGGDASPPSPTAGLYRKWSHKILEIQHNISSPISRSVCVCVCVWPAI